MKEIEEMNEKEYAEFLNGALEEASYKIASLIAFVCYKNLEDEYSSFIEKFDDFIESESFNEINLNEKLREYIDKTNESVRDA